MKLDITGCRVDECLHGCVNRYGPGDVIYYCTYGPHTLSPSGHCGPASRRAGSLLILEESACWPSHQTGSTRWPLSTSRQAYGVWCLLTVRDEGQDPFVLCTWDSLQSKGMQMVCCCGSWLLATLMLLIARLCLPLAHPCCVGHCPVNQIPMPTLLAAAYRTLFTSQQSACSQL